jgi:4-hydroxy-tetrahydrodipicolinate reductase|uniref:4-hydroxy-tetrahydrodipicolinate reductase n=1 Tax=candidate division WOR-3 bacterium TaxID=2052148 RepID=A0A7V3PS55_UNCW3
MIKVAVVGASGRMGSEIVRLLALEDDLELVGGVEVVGHPQIGTKVGSGAIFADLRHLLNRTDVVVDFSTPESVIENVNLCLTYDKPFITGVTGFTAEQLKIIQDAGRKIPVVFAPNFSIGVAVLSLLASQSAKILGTNYDIHLVEIHHKRKKDAPSGTAKLLLEKIRLAIGDKPVDVISIRTGDVIGEHRIIFGGPGERLELVHKAESRTAFASGVITAIRWVVKQPAGFYSLADILGY